MKFAFTMMMTAGFAGGKTYFVSNAGSDAANGLSTGTSWQTISKVNSSTFKPGDTILFKRGDTWREQLTVPSSGQAGRPITLIHISEPTRLLSNSYAVSCLKK